MVGSGRYIWYSVGAERLTTSSLYKTSTHQQPKSSLIWRLTAGINVPSC